ncbi:MAG: hypothetical protein GWO16_09230 [Gammaproteobacteria bacterium]|nr:hypothetical protein [Gammaproteobacteria bacterium]NIR98149.1 hypothetical protein [Gammaproteobacteria bacterium]NIT62536.1 hypothetical protein [Gammaproteobacteria bacterium]NIV20793.1 hypothetical protein [Gammaproteobacteria bacterium]NIY31116.1 hypothetical protein [Gammaproteobacteria bacterium]
MQIERYEFGRIEIGGNAYTSDVIVSAQRVADHWWRKEGHRLAVDDLDAVLAEGPDVVVVGTGYYGRMSVPEQTRAYLAARGIELHAADTRSAVAAFNRLQREAARVVAALHLTC